MFDISIFIYMYSITSLYVNMMTFCFYNKNTETDSITILDRKTLQQKDALEDFLLYDVKLCQLCICSLC